jgi:hypothetical protein
MTEEAETKKPSRVVDEYWIYAYRKKGDYPKPSDNCGKWLVFVSDKEVDEIWEKIRTATEEGKLGLASKVATAKDSPLASSSTRKVICIYTYDWTDRKDVIRIREELRKLGITNKIPYKSDKDTLSGKYRQTGHTKISKYYE